MVGDRALLANGEVACLAEVIDEFYSSGLADFIAELRDQKAHQSILIRRASSGEIAQVLQKLGHPVIHDWTLNLVHRWKFRFGCRAGRDWRRQLGWPRKI